MNGVILFVRVAFSLGLVIGLMWLATRMMRNRGLAPKARKINDDARIEVVDRKGLSKNAAIAVVRVGGRHLVVGITDHQVTNLAEVDGTAFDVDAPVEDRVPLSIVDGTVIGAANHDPHDHAAANWTAAVATGTDGLVPNRPARMGLLDVMRERTVRRL